MRISHSLVLHKDCYRWEIRRDTISKSPGWKTAENLPENGRKLRLFKFEFIFRDMPFG